MIEPYRIVVPWLKEESYLLAPFQSMVCVTSSSYLPSIHECVMRTTESTDIIVSPYIYYNTFFFHSPAFSPHSSIIGHTHTQCILIYQTALSSVSCYNTYNDERELEKSRNIFRPTTKDRFEWMTIIANANSRSILIVLIRTQNTFFIFRRN